MKWRHRAIVWTDERSACSSPNRATDWADTCGHVSRRCGQNECSGRASCDPTIISIELKSPGAAIGEHCSCSLKWRHSPCEVALGSSRHLVTPVPNGITGGHATSEWLRR